MKLYFILTIFILLLCSCNRTNTENPIIVHEEKKSSNYLNGTNKGNLFEKKTIHINSSINGNYDVSSNYYEYLIGKITFSKDKGFVKVDDRFSNKTIYVRTQVNEAFMKMREDAEKNGLLLIIISGARSFDDQKRIWERKWNDLPNNLSSLEKAKEILKYSSMPMSSRHHWGTDIDLNSLENKYFEKGEGLKIYNWLEDNAHKYGFCQVYTDKKKTGRNGFEMEKWHWSYMPLSTKVLEDYNKNISINDFKDFLGCDQAKAVKIIQHYVNGISTCKK